MAKERNKQNQDLKKLIIDFVSEKKPQTVDDLIKMMLKQYPFPKDLLIRTILILNSEGKISLKDIQKTSVLSFQAFIFSTKCTWFWFTLALSFFAMIAALVIPETAFPFVYARYILGSLYVLFLPGYSFLRAVFAKRELERLEQIILGIVLSITIVIFTSLILNYSPWGITLTPLILSLLVITLLSSLIALFREYRTTIAK